MKLLRLQGITKYFGGLSALKDVDVEVEENEIVGIIGPNGAGKTTLFNVITGVYRPNSGKVYFKDTDITGWRPDKIYRLGIARTFQSVRPFNNISTLDNVIIGGIYGKKKLDYSTAKRNAMEILSYIGLKGKENILVKNIPLAHRKLVELAIALNSDPELLLIDEIAAGLTSSEISEIITLIKKLRDEMNITIVWIEHIMKVIMNTAERVVVFNFGAKIAEGTPEEISKDQKVINIYLGEEIE